jgi:hypothetical protein
MLAFHNHWEDQGRDWELKKKKEEKKKAMKAAPITVSGW